MICMKTCPKDVQRDFASICVCSTNKNEIVWEVFVGDNTEECVQYLAVF